MKQITRFYQFLAKHVGQSRNVVVSIFGLSLIDQGFSIGSVYVWKEIIDKYLINVDDWTMREFFIGMLSLVLVWQAMSFVSRLAKNRQYYKTRVLGDSISMAFMERGFTHVINLSMDFHESRSTGQVMRQLTKARDDLNNIILAFFDKLVMQMISFVLVTIFFFYIQWQIAILMLVFIPLFLLVTRHYAKNIDAIQQKINDDSEHSYDNVQQALDGFTVVQSYQTQNAETNRLHKNNHLAHQGLKGKTEAFQRLAFMQGSLVNFVRLAIIAAGGYYVFHGQMTVGEVVLLSMWSYFIYNPMYEFSNLLAIFAEGMDSVDRVEQLLKVKSSIVNPKDGYKGQKVAGLVSFNEVSFSYPAASNRGINNVSFDVPAGTKVAFVGPSGSGKTTLAKLLPRFYDVAGGSITLDGVDVRNWDIGALRNSIGMVQQDVILFNDTIYNNIIYGHDKESLEQHDVNVKEQLLEQVIEASKKAFAHDFIMSLPDGYDTVVGERGVKLSGGEKQRIGIARTILYDPPVLILDEATSALDSESEVMVMRALEKISENRTTLTIAHRLSTIRHCDHILFCDNGEIVERGSHDSLMALGGRYHGYVELQKQKETV